MRSVDASNARTPGTAAAATTRSMASAGCCAEAMTITCERSWERLLTGLDAGDTDDEQLTRTWIAAQDLRLIYHSGDRTRADGLLYRWLTYCADADIPELTRLARTIDSWHTELLAYFDTGGVSNGPTEATNPLIKKIKRIGHGFRNFDNYRLRLLLHCGVDWDTIRATPIRGRLPRSVA
jgi:transposase